MENQKFRNISRSIFTSLFFTFLFVSGYAAVPPRDSLNVPVFGKVYIYNRTTTPQNVIIMISGDGGWKSGVINFTETFSWNDFMPQWKDAFSRLLAKYEKDKPPLVNIDQVKSLPLIITNSKFQDKQAPFALLISGDGGWYGFEQSIADHLANTGIPTVGLDSKKYFWKRRTPEETASDIAKALNFYSKEWGREKFVLIGYSLGAEIVPFIINRLPDEMKSRVKSAVLLSPATTTDFEIHISNMLGMGNRNNTYNTIDEIVNLQGIKTLIIFGDGEKTQIPEILAGKPIVIRKIPGDHHYKFNLPLIIQTMRENNTL